MLSFIILCSIVLLRTTVESTEKFFATNVCSLVLDMGGDEERGLGLEIQSDTSSIVDQMHTIHSIVRRRRERRRLVGT